MLIPRNIFALRSLAASDPCRYALAGVHFHRQPGDNHARAVATDGKVLGMVRWKEDNWEEMPEGTKPAAPVEGFACTVPVADCARAEKAVPRKPVRPILGNAHLAEATANGTVELRATDLDRTETVSAKTIEGMYPDYAVALEGLKVEAEARFNPLLLRDALDALIKVMGKQEHPTVTLGISKTKPAVLKAQADGLEVSVLVMPLVLD